jgi:hypothetical protein
VANPSHTGETAVADLYRTGETAGALAQLTALPRSERRDALEALVAREFRTALLMTDDEELPLEVSYFDLGLTSLRSRGINANVLFNSPTVGRLLSYLADELLADLLTDRGAPAVPSGSAPAGSAQAASDALVNDVLRDLYQA